MHGAVNVRRFMGCIENGEKQNARPKGANLELQRDDTVVPQPSVCITGTHSGSFFLG